MRVVAAEQRNRQTDGTTDRRKGRHVPWHVVAAASREAPSSSPIKAVAAAALAAIGIGGGRVMRKALGKRWSSCRA